MTIEYIYDATSDQKMKLIQFVFENTDTFIMNTFGHVWSDRSWWHKFPIQVMYDGNVIVGLHAFTNHTKGEGIVKTYYIVTHKNRRGQGIARRLTIAALTDRSYDCDTYFVNSEDMSGGCTFYAGLVGPATDFIKNEFGNFDKTFQAPIADILYRNATFSK